MYPQMPGRSLSSPRAIPPSGSLKTLGHPTRPDFYSEQPPWTYVSCTSVYVPHSNIIFLLSDKTHSMHLIGVGSIELPSISSQRPSITLIIFRPPAKPCIDILLVYRSELILQHRRFVLKNCIFVYDRGFERGFYLFDYSVNFPLDNVIVIYFDN